MFLYGAGGHGKVIKEIVEACGDTVVAFIDDDHSITQLGATPVLHSAEGLYPIIVSVGMNRTRKMIVDKLSSIYPVAIHPSAVVSPSAQIGEGTVVMPGAIINADAVIGKHCIINTGASVGHECVVEDFCHVAPHASICGQSHLGEGVMVGVGASVIPCIQIGRWSVVGAGAAVVRSIPNDCVAVGVPAKILKINNIKDLGCHSVLNGGG